MERKQKYLLLDIYFNFGYNLIFQILKCASLAAPLYEQPPVAAQQNMQSYMERLNDTPDMIFAQNEICCQGGVQALVLDQKKYFFARLELYSRLA